MKASNIFGLIFLIALIVDIIIKDSLPYIDEIVLFILMIISFWIGSKEEYEMPEQEEEEE